MQKKSFKGDNPALQFISAAREEREEPKLERIAPAQKSEKKSRRLNLLLQQSVMEDVSKIAHMKKTSVNDLINSVLKEYASNNAELIARYDEFF